MEGLWGKEGRVPVGAVVAVAVEEGDFDARVEEGLQGRDGGAGEVAEADEV